MDKQDLIIQALYILLTNDTATARTALEINTLAELRKHINFMED